MNEILDVHLTWIIKKGITYFVDGNKDEQNGDVVYYYKEGKH